jgi:hypothetical protein
MSVELDAYPHSPILHEVSERGVTRIHRGITLIEHNPSHHKQEE